MEKKDLIKLTTKELPFWKKVYYKSDLNRVCEMEEMIHEWYDLSLISSSCRI